MAVAAMSRYFLLGFCLLFVVGNSNAQSVWKQVHGPYTGTVQQVEIAKDNTIYTVSRTGRFFKQHNEVWHEIALPFLPISATYTYYSIATFDNILFAYNNAPTTQPSKDHGLYRSSDQGNSWTQVMESTDLSSIHQCMRTGNLYAFRGGIGTLATTIFRSSDNGLHWDSLTSIPLQSYDFLVDDSDRCYFLLLQETVGIVRYTPKTNLYKTFISDFNTTTELWGYVSYYKNNIFVRTCCGLYDLKSNGTWEKRSQLSIYPTNSAPTAIYRPFITTNTGDFYTVGLNESSSYPPFLLLRSTDLGNTWKPMNSVEDAEELNFAFDSLRDIYLGSKFGDGIGILASNDTGRTWRQQGLPIASISDLQEAPENILIASYSYSQNKHHFSSDDGDHWDERTSFFNLPTTTGQFARASKSSFFYFDRVFDNLLIWFADSSSTTFIKRDTLRLVKSFPKTGYDSYGFYILLNLPNNQLLRTTDKGLSWEEVQMPSDNLATALFAENTSSLYVAFFNGSNAQLYKSSDEGKSWKLMLDNPSIGSIYSIKVINENIILLASSSGLWRSRDAGLTFELWNSSLTGYNQIEVVGNTCFVASTDQILSCKLSDDHWVVDNPLDSAYPIHNLLAMNDRIYTTLENNGIWYAEPGSVSVDSKFPSSDNSVAIEYSVPSGVKIFLTLKQHSNISLALYDVLGHNSRTITEGTYEAGRQMIAVETATLTPGVYFILLKSSNGNFAQKCLITH